MPLSVSQESAFVPELYFYMLVEVLTYLDKGLGLTGCPADGMDKHSGGMFEIRGPLSKDILIILRNLAKLSHHENPEKIQIYTHSTQCATSLIVTAILRYVSLALAMSITFTRLFSLSRSSGRT